MKELIDQLLARWAALNSREQALLAGAALLCAFALPYGLLWRPMVHSLQQLRTEVPLHQAQLAQMRKEAATIHAGTNTRTALHGGGTDLLSDVENSATTLGMRDAIARMDTDSSRHVRLQLSNAEFDTMAKWIWQMEHQLGIRVLSATISAGKTPGHVDASLRIDRG